MPVNAHPNLQRVVDELVADKVYTRSELDNLMAKARIQEKILNAMKNPAESKLTWGRYRKIFMQPERFESGAEFFYAGRIKFNSGFHFLLLLLNRYKDTKN